MSIFTFFAIGDWGVPERAHSLADDMARSAATMGDPKFVLGLGDNFYPSGVKSVDDEAFNRSWAKPFLRHKSLCCPWHCVLGNHDYEGDPWAQIHFTRSAQNRLLGSCWQTPDNNYSFQVGDVAFFALDTNGVQGHVRRKYPGIADDLVRNIAWLDSSLKASKARCKIVFAHHPMYTKGEEHSVLGRCLKDKTYSYATKCGEMKEAPGYGLEDVLAANRVTAYITGHEHVFQHHVCAGVHSFVAGASVESHYHGGVGSADVNWHDTRGHTGFLAVRVYENKLTFDFIGKLPGGSSSCIKTVDVSF